MNATMTDLFSLGRAARARAHAEVWLRADGAVHLLPQSPDWGKLPREVTEVHYHPSKGQTIEQVREEIAQVRQQYPGARLHGLSPGWLERNGSELLELFDSFCLFTGELGAPPHPAAQGWRKFSELPNAVATLVYGPEHSLEQLQERLKHLENVGQVVPLPRAVGDLVMVSGATTDGTWDIEVLSRCRALLPARVRVRASWGALGFKLAQASLAFGADALAGWGLEEQLAYSGRMRPAELVGWEEARAGLRELR